MTTAMERTEKRMKRHGGNQNLPRTMGVMAGAGAPTAVLVLGAPMGYVIGGFLIFSAAFLFVNSLQN